MISGMSFPLLAVATRFSSEGWLHPSRFVVNTAFWALGIVLQSALVYSIFRKGVARSFPCFAIIAIFYPLRSALLFALSGRIENDDYSTLYNALSLVEAPLQALVAIELLLRRMQEAGGWRALRAPLALLILSAPFALTSITIAAIPPRAQPDRVPVFMSFVMLVIFAVIVKGSRSANAIRISGGIACFALVQLAALAGRAHAMLLRDPLAYLAWGYAPAAIYLAIVLFWIVTFKREARSAVCTSQCVGT